MAEAKTTTNASGGIRQYPAFKAARALTDAVAGVANSYLRTASVFGFNVVARHKSGFHNLYEGLEGKLYSPTNPIGRVFRTLFLPSHLRHETLSLPEQDELWVRSSRLGKYASGVNFGSYIVKTGAIAYLLSSCVENDQCRTSSRVGMGLDAASASSKAAAMMSQFLGFRNLNAAGNQIMGAKLLMGHRALMLFGSLFQIASGVTILLKGLDRYLRTGDANGSTFIMGGSAVGDGLADLIYHGFIFNAARTAPDIANKLTKLSAGIVKFSPLAKIGMRVAGSFGAVFGLGTNAAILAKALTDESLSAEKQREMLISGSLGFVSSMLSLGPALLITPGLQPLGVLLGGLSLVSVGVQCLYDNRDKLERKKI